MTEEYVRPAPRRNTPLTAMIVVGTVMTLAGLFVASLCYLTIVSGPFNTTVGILLVFAGYLASFGVLLLLIAWIIAAARFK